jgi:transposase
MARYKPVDPHLSKMLPVRFADQILPGTFEYAVNWLVDHQIDLSVFDARYCNDQTGATAYHPSVLLKVVLLGYARGLVSSRAIERACRENVVFMALSGDSAPHFTTIASFVSKLSSEITAVFRDVLLVCDEQGLIGKELFAVDAPLHQTHQALAVQLSQRHRRSPMQYLLIISHDAGFASSEALVADILAWIERMQARGIRCHGAPLRPPSDAVTLRVREGQLQITPGPYSDSREQMCAYELLDCASQEEALAAAAEHPMARVATIELRPVWTELASR